MTKRFVLCLLLIGSLFFSYSKNSLQFVDINPSLFENSNTAKQNLSSFRFDNKDFLVIHLNNEPSNYLSEKNIDIQTYLGNGYYLIASDISTTKSIAQNSAIDKFSYISADSKIDYTLKNMASTEPITVLFAASVSANTLANVTQQIGISIQQMDAKYAHFTTFATKEQIQKLATFPFVYFITKNYPTKNPLIYESSLMLGVNQIKETQPYGYNLKGDGIHIGIWDDGVPSPHVDLPINKNFVIDKAYNSMAYMFHPTEVAGCIASNGNIFPTIQGIAPHSNLFYWDVLGDIVQEIENGKNQYAVDISNHSYNFAGTNCFQSGAYIPEAADLDKLVYQQPTLLPVVAVGNTASFSCSVATDTFSSVDIGFQGCKNALTVGWLFSNEKIVENSGRGPTEDGRLKPELVAKGFAVTTTIPTNTYSGVYGSSYASPQIAGLAALLYQKYKQQFSGIPNASLIKAILLNSARDLGNKGPDYTYGYGIPDALRAVNSLSNTLFFENSIQQDELKTASIFVPNNLAQLKVTLSWTDKEGSPVAQKSLVNNLDLKIVTPAGDTVLPWVLTPTIPRNLALRNIDNLNNNEQVTIDKPLSGNYTIVVKGTAVPFGPQNYAVAYYNQERKIELTHPNGGEILDPGTSNIRWYANDIDSIAKIEFSSDNGANWQTVINNQQLNTNIYSWTLPNIVSNQCLIKITSGNNVAVSAAPFTIGTQIYYPSINHSVCDRTVKINWPAVAGATAYKVYLFVDSMWTLAGQTNLLTYTINNLTNGKNYMYAISTIKNGVEGNHSLANSFTPIANGCTTLKDVGVYAMNKPLGGRKFTSANLSNAEKLSFIIKNYGTATQSGFTVFYKLNNGPTRSIAFPGLLTANDTAIVNFLVNEDLSAVGNYSVVAWTNLSGDENSANDTLKYTIRNLANAPISLPFSESFESLNVNLSNTAFGLNGLDYLDYYPNNGGRLRTNISNIYANTGKRAITLDNYNGITSKNELIFTYNLSNYVDSIIYLDFNYMNSAEPDSNDLVFARGNDTLPWVRVYDLFSNRAIQGTYKNVQEINLYKILKEENAQSFSSSTQLKILQTGKNATNSPASDGGYTFDDFKLYTVGNDVAVLTASNSKKIYCSKSVQSQSIKIKVKNNSNHTITNLPVAYKVDNNTTINEVIPTTLLPNDTLTYTFSTLFNNHNSGKYTIKTWASNATDFYKNNDTNQLTIMIMPTIDSFPYYNDFESNNGNLFSDGVNNSWVWGTPIKYNMNDAAQDNKAWTTGLARGYNFNEDSYLYMGCLDFSSVTSNPLISFDFISLLQQQSDSAFAEYSTDGTSWNRLGCYDCGENWYNGYQNNPYWDNVVFPWQVAHTIVPLADLQDPSQFMWRIHLLSDDFAVSEGIGIDDLHILTNYETIATTDSAYMTQTSAGNGWISFHRNGKLVAELYDDHKNLGNILLGYEANPLKYKTFDNKNILQRNWVIKPENNVLGNYKLRLYVLNSEYTNFILNEDSINRMGDIKLLRYIGLNTNLDVYDNHVTSFYKYFSPQEIQFYPYQNGYYVEFSTDTLGEFYLMSTKQDADAIQNINLIDFSAQKLNDDVYLQWKTTREINSKEFIVQYSFDANTFIDIDTLPAGGFSTNTTLYNYLHELNATSGVYYYRIKMLDNTNKISYSLIDSVYFAPTVGIKQNTTQATAYIASNDIVVAFKNMLQLPSTVFVYNTLGQLQFTKKMTLSNGINPLGIPDFPNWNTGAYFLQIQTAEHNYYSKLLKQ